MSLLAVWSLEMLKKIIFSFFLVGGKYFVHPLGKCCSVILDSQSLV